MTAIRLEPCYPVGDGHVTLVRNWLTGPNEVLVVAGRESVQTTVPVSIAALRRALDDLVQPEAAAVIGSLTVEKHGPSDVAGVAHQVVRGEPGERDDHHAAGVVDGADECCHHVRIHRTVVRPPAEVARDVRAHQQQVQPLLRVDLQEERAAVPHDEVQQSLLEVNDRPVVGYREDVRSEAQVGHDDSSSVEEGVRLPPGAASADTVEVTADGAAVAPPAASSAGNDVPPPAIWPPPLST